MTAKVTWTLDRDETSWAGWAEARAGAPASPMVRELIAAHPAPAGGWAIDARYGDTLRESLYSSVYLRGTALGEAR
ncbi:MAG TPA: hypothetical protein VLC95_01605 [Anaerolineae bacterium]|nr:hypothetical protein [Anaerolineae bacterium]